MNSMLIKVWTRDCGARLLCATTDNIQSFFYSRTCRLAATVTVSDELTALVTDRTATN
jgi:hypothetical protein